MSWRLEYSGQARRDLARLDRAVAARVLDALDRLATTDQGDVRRLSGRSGELRLRVRDWRVLFLYEASSQTIQVLRVLPRDRAYRN